MSILIYLGGKYATSYHITDLIGMAANIHNTAAYTYTLLGKAIAHYNLIPTNYFYLE